MHFVYYIQSQKNPDKYYVGLTNNVDRRLAEHNSGESSHTNKFRPWKLIGYTAFQNIVRAECFEAYLKTASGRAFARKRL